MVQRRKIVQRQIVARCNLEPLAYLAKQLGLLDAIDPQIRLQVRVHLDNVFRITRLLDHKTNQDLPKFVGIRHLPCQNRFHCMN